MDLRILLALVLAALLLWLGVSQLRSSAPSITSIEFPQEIQADGQEVVGLVSFQDPDGDIVEVRFEVIQAVLFESFRFDPQVQGQKQGEFAFYLYSLIPQEIILEVILVDRADQQSSPLRFKFRASESTGEDP